MWTGSVNYLLLYSKNSPNMNTISLDNWKDEATYTQNQNIKEKIFLVFFQKLPSLAKNECIAIHDMC